MRPLRFSDHFGITRTSADDWFDPLLNEDTRLFVDPFLIFMDKHPDWANGHPRLMEFFNVVLQLLAASGFDNDNSPGYVKAKGLLMFPEPPEFCLGLSRQSIFGAGSAKGLQRGMLRGAKDAIDLGITSLRHVEEIALLGEQIGADRISDMTCDVLKADFIAYTQEVARRHKIPMSKVNVGNADWDPDLKAWKPGVVDLPVNPLASRINGRPIGVILTPKRFLRQIPTVDPSDFWDFAWANEADQLRAQFNYEVGRNVDRGRIATLARRRRHLLTKYLQTLEEKGSDPYDVDADPSLVVSPPDFANEVADAFTTPAPKSEAEFVAFVEALIANFKYCVEQRGAWRSLWVKDKPRPEKHAQILFDVSGIMACHDRDVDLTRESDAGRGPVDFKFSRGRKLRALMEIKLAKSASFRRNLTNQTSTYAGAEKCNRGYFVAIQFTDAHCDPAFMKESEDLAAQVAQNNKMAFKIIWVDARPKKSGSKV